MGDPAEQILDFGGACVHDNGVRWEDSAEAEIGRAHQFFRAMRAAARVFSYAANTHGPDRLVRFIVGETAIAHSPSKRALGDVGRLPKKILRNLSPPRQTTRLARGKATADHLEHFGNQSAAAKGLKDGKAQLLGGGGELLG